MATLQPMMCIFLRTKLDDNDNDDASSSNKHKFLIGHGSRNVYNNILLISFFIMRLVNSFHGDYHLNLGQ